MILFEKEGETPLDDISGLKIESITTRSALDEAEAENILEAFLKYTVSPEQLDTVQFDRNRSIFCVSQIYHFLRNSL